MPRSDSPFRAGFGKTPPLLAGRQEVLDDFRTSIEAGAWSQERVTLIEGFRGVGKTVTLNALEDIARGLGWIVISETATPGFVSRITNDHLQRAYEALNPQPARRVIGGSITPIGSIHTSLTPSSEPTPTLRRQIERVAETIEPAGAGILITLDEVNSTSADDLRAFATDFQHAVREDREVALVASGLQSGIADLLREKSLTFLRRAATVQLDLLSYPDTRDALAQPIVGAGRSIDGKALEFAAIASRGYPFLVQLIGDLAWKARPGQATISLADAQAAFRRARRTMGSNIHEPSLRDLSPTDRTVLAAIAVDDGPSTSANLRERLGVSTNYLSMYRQRLLEAGVIYSVGRGKVDVAVPYLREYLKSHVVTGAVTEIARRRAEFPPLPKDIGTD